VAAVAPKVDEARGTVTVVVPAIRDHEVVAIDL
jgi:hypothetical protein